VYQVLLDDFIDILAVDIAVPGGFGVNHQHRAQGAAIETTGGIDAHATFPGQATRLDLRLGVLPDPDRPRLRAALLTALALVGTEKYGIFIILHIAPHLACLAAGDIAPGEISIQYRKHA